MTPRRGVPHPTSQTDLRTLLACSTGPLYLAYVLAAFAGLRCGEICGPRVEDLIHRKGGYERIVPLLPPVVAELTAAVGQVSRGPVITHPKGGPWQPDQICIRSHSS